MVGALMSWPFVVGVMVCSRDQIGGKFDGEDITLNMKSSKLALLLSPSLVFVSKIIGLWNKILIQKPRL
jgi:hypothetical protein